MPVSVEDSVQMASTRFSWPKASPASSTSTSSISREATDMKGTAGDPGYQRRRGGGPDAEGIPLEAADGFHGNGLGAFLFGNTHHDLAGKIIPRSRLGGMAQQLPEFCIVLFVHRDCSIGGSITETPEGRKGFLAASFFLSSAARRMTGARTEAIRS